MANSCGTTGIVLSGFVLLFSILATALPYWETGDSLNIGLWNYCLENGRTLCFEVTSSDVTYEQWQSLQAVRAMVMLGILLSAGALVAGILVMFVLKSSKLLFFAAGGLDIAAGLFLMIGMAVYVDKRPNDQYGFGVDFSDHKFSAAFALDITAWILAWVAGLLFIAAKLTDKQ